MFNLRFFEDRNGKSEIVDLLDGLQSLKEKGTRIGSPYVKHIEGTLWELRPLKNRIFFFCWHNNTYVLLSHFVKKTQKAPEIELERARNNQRDFIGRETSE
jgi:phage-related protein